MNLAVLFVVMLNGAPVAHYDDAFSCNQAAIELSNEGIAGCHSFAEDGTEISVRGDREIRYVYPQGAPAPLRFEWKVVQ